MAIKRGKHPHPIVILSDDCEELIACVISTKNTSDNIAMKEVHFEKTNSETGKRHDIQFNNSYLVKDKFIKFKVDLKATRKGQITPKGLEFINKELDGIPPRPLEGPIWKSINKQSNEIAE